MSSSGSPIQPIAPVGIEPPILSGSVQAKNRYGSLWLQLMRSPFVPAASRAYAPRNIVFSWRLGIRPVASKPHLRLESDAVLAEQVIKAFANSSKSVVAIIGEVQSAFWGMSSCG